jgi:hypothetical protein
MRFLAAVSTAVVLWMTAACDRKTTSPLETKTSEGQASEAPAGKSAARQDQALVRFINADPHGAPRDLWTGDTSLFTGIAYRAITPYVEIPSQATQFRLRETGKSQNLASVHDELFAGRSYTYIAMPGKNGSSSIAEISDDFKPPKAGKARVRLINATLGVTALDLHETGVAKKIGPGVRAGASTDFKDVDPGTFEIRPDKQPGSPQLTNLTVEPDRFYTFVVLGKAGDLDVVRIEERLDR